MQPNAINDYSKSRTVKTLRDSINNAPLARNILVWMLALLVLWAPLVHSSHHHDGDWNESHWDLHAGEEEGENSCDICLIDGHQTLYEAEWQVAFHPPINFIEALPRTTTVVNFAAGQSQPRAPPAH